MGRPLFVKICCTSAAGSYGISERAGVHAAKEGWEMGKDYLGLRLTAYGLLAMSALIALALAFL